MKEINTSTSTKIQHFLFQPWSYMNNFTTLHENIDLQLSYSATALDHPALPPVSFTGKQDTLKPNGLGRASRFASFSIWQYSCLIPALCAAQRMLLSWVCSNSSLMAFNGLSHPPGIDAHYPAPLFNQPERRLFCHTTTRHKILWAPPQLVCSGLYQNDIPRFDDIRYFFERCLQVMDTNTRALRFVPEIRRTTPS